MWPSVRLSLLDQLLLCLREQTEAELIESHFRYLISARLFVVASLLPPVSRQQLWIWPHLYIRWLIQKFRFGVPSYGRVGREREKKILALFLFY